jgi:hypothetical protein
LPDGDISLGVGIDDNATSTAITINASENVGIGDTTPAVELSVVGAIRSGDGNTLGFEMTGNGAGGHNFLDSIIDDDSYDITIRARAAGTPVNLLKLEGTGDVIVPTGNLVIGTSGKGIDFSATSDGSGTMTSEVLDDYEEGTFTPTVVGLTTAGVATYTLRSARYTKIGNIVTFELGVGWSAHTGTGILAINGLPFTPGGSRKIFTVGRMIGLTTSELGMRSWSEASSTQVRFSTTDTAGVESQINLDASVTMLYVSGTYPT